MTRLLLSFLLSVSLSLVNGQNYLVLKKHERIVQTFYVNEIITVRANNGEWINGPIIALAHDSIFIHRQALRYEMTGIDTVHLGMVRLALRDIEALPRRGAMVVFRNDRPYLIYGHEKFVWLKNGFVPMVAGGGYIFLNVLNTYRDGDNPFKGKNITRLAIAGGVLGIGALLHYRFKNYRPIGKKFRLEITNLTNEKPTMKAG